MELAPVSMHDRINVAVIKSEMIKTIKDFCRIDSILVSVLKEFKGKIVTADKHSKASIELSLSSEYKISKLFYFIYVISLARKIAVFIIRLSEVFS